MTTEKIKNTYYVLLTVIAAGLLLMIFFGKLFPVFLPFMISYAIACLATAPAMIFEKKIGANRGKIRLFISLFALLVISLALFLLARYAAFTLWEIAKNYLEGDKISNVINGILAPLESIFGDSLSEGLGKQLIESATGFFTGIVSSLGAIFGSVANFLPKMFLFLVVTIISLIYFSLDLEEINKKIKSILPEKWGSKLSFAREKILSVGVRYVTSYLLLMGITFSVMLAGFFILRIKHPFLLAFLIAFFDLFPIIGVGTAVIPWAIIELVLGKTGRGIGLIILFVVNEFIRQFAEPKIVGKSLNMHPLITLILIYATISLFGIKGILLIPIFVALAGTFNAKESIK